MRKAISSLLLLMMVVLLVGCAAKKVAEDKSDSASHSVTPLVIEERHQLGIDEAVKQEVRRILGGDVTLTVYSDNDATQSFAYKGKLEVVDDGTDGSDIILFIHADTITSSDDWF